MSNYLDLSLEEIHTLLKNKTIKPIDLVNECFSKIEKNKDYNCYITLNKEQAEAKAKELENVPVSDDLLFGIPIAIKDNIITKDLKTTAASHMLYNFVPIYDAYVVKLLKQHNMIIIGKLNMDEFAMGSSNQTSYYGPVKNPLNKDLVSGGSSGGSACAVALGMPFLSLGTDTGGSIRQPSSFCGVVGMKPTYGLVSRYGLIAFASSLDQIGPITRTVKENALLLNAISEKDSNDLTQEGKKEEIKITDDIDLSKLKIAIPKFYLNDKIDKEILNKFNEIKSLLTSKGCQIDVVDIKYLENSVSLYQIIALGEASSNLARYDGIRYGYSTTKFTDINDFYKATRSEGFGPEVKRRLMIGSYLLSGANAKVYYEKALKIRHAMIEEFHNVFHAYDYIIGPTTTTLPYPLGANNDDPNKSFIDDILTIPVNMAGLPALNLPIGYSKDNLAIGMQIIANRFEENKIYNLANYLEQALNLGGKHE